MSEQEKHSVLMTQRELDALCALPERLKLALASPTCLSGQLFTFLDQLQIALNAIAIKATIGEGYPQPGQRLMRYSTVLRRETQSQVYRDMVFDKIILKGSDGDDPFQVDWSIASRIRAVPPGATSRKILSTANFLMTITWGMLALGDKSVLPGSQPDSPESFDTVSQKYFQKLGIWVNCSETDNDHLFWRHAVESIRTAVEICLQMTPVIVLSETEEGYKKELIRFQEQHIDSPEISMRSNARSTIRRVFIDFNERLKWLLKNHAAFPHDALNSPFLAQFFWVTYARDQSDPLSLSQVAPIFLPEQEGRLRENGADDDQLLELNDYTMDSRSLFSAFPADTLMSTYIEQWDKEEISRGQLLPPNSREFRLRNLFFSLTSKTQRKEVKSFSSTDDPIIESDDTRGESTLRGQGTSSTTKHEPLNLFTVPVLVGDRPIFVVQINSRSSLPAETRNVLADAVRALGGIVAFRIHFHMLKEFEKHRKNAVVRAALLYQTSILSDEARGLKNKYSHLIEHKSRKDGDIPAGSVLSEEIASIKSIIGEFESIGSKLRRKSQIRCVQNEVVLGTDKPSPISDSRTTEKFSEADKISIEALPFNLAEAIKQAIVRIPMRLLHGIYIPPPVHQNDKEMVKGFRDAFIVAVQNIIVNSAAYKDRDAALFIKSRRTLRYPPEGATTKLIDRANARIELSFEDNGHAFGYTRDKGIETMGGLFQADMEIREMGGEMVVDQNGSSNGGGAVFFILPIPD